MELIRDGDFGSLLGAILVLVALGRLLTTDRQKKAGWLVAILAFIAYAVYAWPPQTAGDLFEIVLRATLAFGLVLGFTWVVLPLAWIVWELVRLMRAASAARVREWQAQESARRLADEKRVEDERLGRERELQRQRSAEQQAEWQRKQADKPQRIKEAKERHEARKKLIVEESGLKDHDLHDALEMNEAKYLREIDEIMR